MALSKIARGRGRKLAALGVSLAAASAMLVLQPDTHVGAATVSLEEECTMAEADAVEYGSASVSPQIKQQLTASVLPLSIPGDITATANVLPGGVIHTVGTLNVDIQPYAQNILDNQVKPAIKASNPGFETTAFLNLFITNLKTTFPVPPEIASTSNLSVTHTGSVSATGALSPGKIDVTLGEIKAGAYSLNPNNPSGPSSTTSTSIPTLAPFSVTLEVDGTVDPSTPVGTVIQLHPGGITFDLKFEVGVYFFGSIIQGGVTGPEICLPASPSTVLASTQVVSVLPSSTSTSSTSTSTSSSTTSTTQPSVPRFNDVPFDYPFYADIEWLASNGYANGYQDGGYHPTAPIARQAMAAFLYRYKGSPNGPTPTCTGDTGPYNDVPVSHPFCGEISWMKSTGITGGYPDGGFHPTDPVARQAMAAFLYRYNGSPNGADPACPGPDAPYNDVPLAHPFCGEISWMKTTNITQGFQDGGYHPSAAVSRQAMAAFLHRYDGLPS